MPDDLEEALLKLYADFDAANLAPLWTVRASLQPASPTPEAEPALWRWSELYPLAARAGEIVPVGRGGERRAIALVNPGLGGEPYATPTLWAAIQFLNPGEQAPAHRHSQSAFRFVLEGEGVFTNVDGDAVAMRRGDLLLTANWRWHEHHNTSSLPMAWLDGLDVPLVAGLDAGFFEFGPETLSPTATPAASRSERLWGGPGLRPLGAAVPTDSPLVAYRFEHTDTALAAQLELAEEGVAVLLEPGYAAVPLTNPATAGDALRTIRTEMHRLAPGTRTAARRTVGSAVWQIFSGAGEVYVGEQHWSVGAGDVLVVPSWAPFALESGAGLDAFSFSDAPVYEALGLFRSELVTD